MNECLFSFVLPARNAERCLMVAVESVLAQTVGFRDHIQLVLVNDGSDDNTGALCATYRALYPNNVVHIDQPHGGAASARNAGMRAATGRRIVFLDADDKWEPDACAAARDFFEDHPQVNVACFPVRFFGSVAGEHPMNDKFAKGTRVVHLLTNMQACLPGVLGVVVKREAALKRPFDERLPTGEDMAWIAELLLDEGRFGVISGSGYWHRRRTGVFSATDAEQDDRSRPVDAPCPGAFAVMRHAEERAGASAPWAWYAVTRALAERFRERDDDSLTPAQKEAYRASLRACLARIADSYILTARGLHADERLCALALKHDMGYEDIKAWVRPDEQEAVLSFCRPGAVPVPFARPWTLRVEFLDIRNGCLELRGSCPVLVGPGRIRLILTADQADGATREYPGELFRRPDRKKCLLLGVELWALESFEVSLPLAGRGEIRAFADIDGIRFELRWRHEALSPLARGNGASYLARNGHIVRRLPGEQGLEVTRAGLFRVACRELAFLRQAWAASVEEGREGKAIREAACLRLLARCLRRLSKKAVWLISDRVEIAGDNGEALFEYLMALPKHRCRARPVFVLDRASDDWERLRRLGPVAAYGSRQHKLLFLVADKIISSSANMGLINPFGTDRALYRTLWNFDFVFLQHGVIKDDLSAGFNRIKKNFALFVTSAKREWASIAAGDYGYTPEQVVLTGLPRHDKLLCRAAREKPRCLVAVMPTWRANQALVRDAATGLRPSNPAFKASAYFRFWDGFIRHPRLLDSLRRHDFCLRFVPHPQFAQEAGKFRAQAPVEVLPRCDYAQTFCEAALLVTDYSSVAFDFALLRKPLVYAQPDRDAFYRGHTYDKGYFDYARDGFGPVCPDMETTVDAVIRYLETGCIMEAKYRERVDAFFGPQPENRCQAVLDAVNALGRRPR